MTTFDAPIWLCARYELVLAVRSRWLQIFAVVFAGLALAALWLLAKLWRTHWMLGVLALPLLGVAALFAAWAAAIHLTGGEKFDDHPWV